MYPGRSGRWLLSQSASQRAPRTPGISPSHGQPLLPRPLYWSHSRCTDDPPVCNLVSKTEKYPREDGETSIFPTTTTEHKPRRQVRSYSPPWRQTHQVIEWSHLLLVWKSITVRLHVSINPKWWRYKLYESKECKLMSINILLLFHCFPLLFFFLFTNYAKGSLFVHKQSVVI